MSDELVKTFIEYLAPTLVIVISAGVSAGILLALKKLGYDVSNAQAARVKDEVADLVEAVEEIAAAKKAAGSPMASTEKLELAVKKVQVKYPKIKSEAAKDLIHSLLPKLNLGALAKSVKVNIDPGFRI